MATALANAQMAPASTTSRQSCSVTRQVRTRYITDPRWVRNSSPIRILEVTARGSVGPMVNKRFWHARRRPGRETPREVSPRGVLPHSTVESACGPQVDLAFRQRAQLLVGDLFLIERLLQNTGAIVASKLPRPRDQAAVARDLIVLGGLRGIDQGRVQHGLVGDLACDLVGFLDDAVDRRAIDRLHLGAVHAEYLLEALHMRPGFVEMGQKALLELLVGGLFGHFWQRFYELLLGIVDILQLMYEQVVHGLDVFGEQSHCGLLHLGNMQAQAFSGRTYASYSMLIGG